MNRAINHELKEILDLILPDFELNEVINVKKSIRKKMTDTELSHVPVNSHADAIKEFLIGNGFAKNLAGEAIIKVKGIALQKAKSVYAFEKMMNQPHDFIVVDDDDINNLLCKTLIERVYHDARVLTYNDPAEGLIFLESIDKKINAKNTVLLLDINMPVLSGWDVLEQINKFSENAKDKLKIFMLTSSIDPKDKERAINIPTLWGYIEKPLTDVKLRALFS